MIGGFSALAGVLLVGPRIGKFRNGKPVVIPVIVCH
jgi:Amt family ammonium transporter